jgi:hypothetical protein
VFIREKKILKYIYIYIYQCIHIYSTNAFECSVVALARSRSANSLSIRWSSSSSVVRRALSFIFSLFLSFFFFFPDKFRVLKSQALSRHVFPPLSGLAGRPILLYFSRATRTHNTQNTHTQKMQSMIAQRASAFARAPRTTRQVRKRDSNISF